MDPRLLLFFLLLIHDGYFVGSARVHRRGKDDLTLSEKVRHKENALTDYMRDDSGLSRSCVSEEKCGKRPLKTGNRLKRILGGSVSEKGFWPWHVALFNSDDDYICGGTLIAPRWVLTAAHCTLGEYDLSVALGEHHLEHDDDKEIKMKVEDVINHDGFRYPTLTHDIALLRLSCKVEYNDYILPACLPISMAELPKHMRCTVSGWGKEKASDFAGSKVLKEVEVPIVSRAECKQAYPRHPSKSFCAGSKKLRTDTCQGDSGGPLVCNIKGSWFVYGVTSYGFGCREENNFNFGVYTEVASYIGWIEDTMSQYDL